MREIIAYIFIGIGVFFMAVGTFGNFRFREFYSRVLISSNVDSTGIIMSLIGVMIYKGFTTFTLKVFLLMVTFIILNPISTHKIAYSAYHSGLDIKGDE
jgi:multicomponent Na+:H+ antiporter subunit G